MNLPVRAIRDERGVPLPLALFALVMLSGLLLAFLTMGGMDTEMASNLSDVEVVLPSVSLPSLCQFVSGVCHLFTFSEFLCSTQGG